MISLKELGTNRLFPVFAQIFYVVVIFVTVLAGGNFLLGKIAEVNKLLADETANYKAALNKLDYLTAFPYDLPQLLQKMNVVLPGQDAAFITLTSFKNRALGRVVVSDVSVGGGSGNSISLTAQLGGSTSDVFEFVSELVNNYPVCDLSQLKYDANLGLYNVSFVFYQSLPVAADQAAVFTQLTKQEEDLIGDILGVSLVQGVGNSLSPSSYDRNNPF